MKTSLLGFYVSDTVTGFSGVVTGEVTYLTGCVQCLVQPRVKEEGAAIPDASWVDRSRLYVRQDHEPVVIAAPTLEPGCDRVQPGGSRA